MLDAQQRYEERVAPCLRDDSRTGVDQDDSEVGRRAAGYHVARVLLVARRVGDDELALVRGEVSVGHVDGDALLALGLQSVAEQGVVDVVAGVAHTFAVAFQGGELVFVEFFESKSRRPMRVDLPSSTDPAVRKRRRSFFSSWSRNSLMDSLDSAVGCPAMFLGLFPSMVHCLNEYRGSPQRDGPAGFRNSPRASSVPSRRPGRSR